MNYGFGSPGCQAVVGEWNHDGNDEIGVFLNGGWWLDDNGNGAWDVDDTFSSFGSPGCQAVTGDWNGDGTDEIGVFLNGGWWLDGLRHAVRPGDRNPRRSFDHGTNLGPHTAAASGKVTAWDKPGLYAVTLDAVDTDASYGLLPSNTSLVPQSKVYPMILGVLTPTIGRSVGGAGPVVARFVEFESTARSLVRTPASLVGATPVWEHAVISYHVE